MNTNSIVGIIAGVAIIGGAGYYLVRGSTSVAPEAAVTETQEKEDRATAPTGEVSPKFTGSFADLAARGGSWKCTIDSSTAQVVSSGTVYVLGSNVRGDFTTAVQGFGNVESHMIADGAYIYTWSPMMPQGAKTKMSSVPQSGITQTSGQSVSSNQSYSYDCQPSSPDTTLFTLPANVTFKSY